MRQACRGARHWPAAGPAVAGRCCPGGISRGTRAPRYPSDTSDAEQAVTGPALAAPAWKQGGGGRPAGHCRRDIVDAIRHLVKEGICWRAMPTGFPPWQTVYDLLNHWQDGGATEAMHGELRRQYRIAAGRKPEPSAAAIDSQSVKLSWARWRLRRHARHLGQESPQAHRPDRQATR